VTLTATPATGWQFGNWMGAVADSNAAITTVTMNVDKMVTANFVQPGNPLAWGYNWYGQLGDDTTTDRTAPVQVSSLSGVTTIAGGGVHSLAVKNAMPSLTIVASAGTNGSISPEYAI
jgi:hypothetical protein